ncbi:MAG: Hydroxyethylthiazole kinase, partial [bacterium 42_11]
NIGTPESDRIKCMLKALTFANNKGIPVVLDPVGCGASDMRRKLVLELLSNGSFSIVKGNHGEILSIYGLSGIAKGVDSPSLGSFESDIRSLVKELAIKYNSLFVSTGEVNFFSDGEEVFEIAGGVGIMSKVTGMGCALGSVMATFLTVADPLTSVFCALELFSEISKRAYSKYRGVGSFKIGFLDELYILGEGYE